ncbi:MULTISPECIES: DUF4286 family protein [Flammeovirga]|uniref:DUF4286 family protein n=1 Tax=Flammeovirga agarivorans TaxID=2726742 RepID=A0A7X8SM95_9BACT|nr:MULTISPECIES: DUF4286 family protein [Flammeovirga]NLR92844.1 DUF4286 family protein [Flammeovirga agarivorans]
MIIYNLSFHVEDEVLPSWKQWMNSFFIPAVMKSECFTQYKLMKLLSEKAEQAGTNFALMLDVDNLVQVDKFMRQHEMELHTALKNKFGEKVSQFRTVLREESI